MKKVISTEKSPIKLWLDDIEEGALAQAKNLANLPFVYKWIAIMPDSHQGYGMPIGAVLPTQEVIIPNAVGVDIGAVDKETEVLTKNGWISIDKYKDQDVLVWDHFQEASYFAKPLLYIVKPCEDFTEYKNKYGLDQVLSDEHRMLVYEGYGKNKNNNTYFCRDFREKLLKLKKQDYYSVRTTFPTKEGGVNFTDEQLAIRIMVSADGHVRKVEENRTSIELHFKKQRKIDRSKVLLGNANINFTESKHKDGTVSMRFELGWHCDKDLTDLFLCSQDQAKVIFDEYLHWDGSADKKGCHKNYSSTNKRNADVIQYICALNNVRANIDHQVSKNERWEDCYITYRTGNAYVGFAKPKEIKIENGSKYCFVVPTGYFIARRNGNIFITGNCGMVTVKSDARNVSKEDIKKIFGGSKDFHGGIRANIPVGFNWHKKSQEIEIQADHTDMIIPHIAKSQRQVGTLGGGNHFIELQEDADGYLYIMIHSGSRNLGMQVAEYYNKKAIELNKKWRSVVPEPWELAFLPLDTKDGQDYIKDMNYCIEFALQNRLLMMQRAMQSVQEVLPDTKFGEINNEPHNFARMENHFGKNVMVHRKGATSARNGEEGMIPGSQGTHSYLVKGKGNEDSFHSCSHGSGRKMGRNQAVRSLDMEQEIKNLDDLGVVHSIRSVKDLDEAPGSYKDIEVVMSNQQDLVDIQVKLKPRGVVKG